MRTRASSPVDKIRLDSNGTKIFKILLRVSQAFFTSGPNSVRLVTKLLEIFVYCSSLSSFCSKKELHSKSLMDFITTG